MIIAPRTFATVSMLLAAALLSAMPQAAMAGEMGNLVMLSAAGKTEDNASLLPDPVCRLADDCRQIVGAFLERISTRRQRLFIITASPNESDCHACTSKISLQVFEGSGELAQGWKLSWQRRNFTDWGDWGIVEPREVRMHLLANGMKILQLDNTYMAQGIISTAMQLHLIDGQHITQAGLFHTACNTFGGITYVDLLEKWQATPSFGLKKGVPTLTIRLRDALYGRDSTSHFVLKKGRFAPAGLADKRLFKGC